MCEKDLGTFMDRSLSFDTQRKEQIKKATRMVGAIRRAFKYLNSVTFVKLYKSLVRSHLESNVCVWYPYKIKDIIQIKSVQKRATKLLPEMKGLSYQQRLEHLNLPTLEFRRCRGDMIRDVQDIEWDVRFGCNCRYTYENGPCKYRYE